MKSFAKLVATLSLVVAAVALCAPGPGASSGHFVVTNENIFDGNNTSVILKLGGTRTHPTLPVLETEQTDVTTQPNIPGPTPNIQIVHSGTNFCIFVGDSEVNGNAISSFLYPGFALVDNHSDPGVPSSDAGDGVVAAGDLLLAGYGDSTTYSGYIGVWRIGKGCTLSLLNTYSTFVFFTSMGVTPDGRTLLISYTDRANVDSFSIGADGTLTEHGPYASDGIEASGVDITADSKYAIFDVDAYNYPHSYLEVEIYPINSDGSLGQVSIFGDGALGTIATGSYVRLSPDQRFLFTDSDAKHYTDIVTLDFNESPLSLTNGGCSTKLRGASGLSPGQLMTVVPSGAGGGLYVPETGNPEGEEIGLLSINPSTGCTKEVERSPFLVDTANGRLTSVAAWPPRPF